MPSLDGFQRLEKNGWVAYPLRGVSILADHDHRSYFLPWTSAQIVFLARDGLYEYDADRAAARVLKRDADAGLGPLTVLVPSSNGGAWVCGREGVGRVSRVSSGSIDWSVLRFPQSAGECRSVLEGEHGELFVSTLAGTTGGQRLLHYDGAAWTTLATSESGRSLVGWPAGDGSAWVAEISRTTFELRSGTGSRESRSRALSGRFLSVLYEGRGCFWVATSLGLARFAPPVWRTPGALLDKTGQASAILRTRAGGLYLIHGSELLERKGGRWSTFLLPGGFDPDPSTHSLVELPDGRLALASGPGLLVFDPIRSSFTTIRHPDGRNVSVLGPGRNGTAWVLASKDGRSHRLERFDGNSFSIQYDAAERWGETIPRAVQETGDGTLYIVPQPQGIGVLKDGHYHSLGAEQGYPGRSPLAVAEVAPGKLWFGDRNSVVEYDGRGFVTIRDNLQTVRSILKAGDGSIWVASGRGLSRFWNGEWINIANTEGLPDAAVYGVAEDAEGRIWATTTAGISRSDPGADTEPPQTLLDMDANPRHVPPSGEARFVFSGMDKWKYTPEARLLYSWRLDGGPWSRFAASDSAEFQHLERGKSHVLEVRAVDRNGNVDPDPSSLAFDVLLPWYLEPGFLASCFLGLFALTGAGVLTLVRQRQLATLVERRTSALAARNKQFQQVAAAVPGVLYSFRMTPEGQFSVPYANQRIFEMAGVRAEDLVAEAGPLFDTIHPDDMRRVSESIAASAASLTLWHDEFRVVRAGQPVVWIEGRSIPSREPGGSILWHGFMSDVTERKRLEEAARRETEREMVLLQTLVAEAPYGLAMLDRGLRQIQASERWLAGIGLSREQSSGRTISELLPTLEDRWMDACRRGLRGEVVSEQDDHFTRADGSERWVNWTVCPWGDSGEETGGIIIYTEDITERKQAEESARETEIRFSELFVHMSEVLIYGRMLYADGVPYDFEYLAVNESYRRLNPARPAVVGKLVSEVLPGLRQSDPAVLEFYGRVASTGKPESTELFVQATKSWYSISSYSPKPGEFVGIFSVITGRKRAEEELRRSQAMLHSIINSALDGLIAIDGEGRTVLWNPAAERIFGYTAAEVASEPLHKLIGSTGISELFSQGFELIGASGQTPFVGRTVEMTAVRKDGTEFPVELSVAPVHMSDSFRAVGVVRDVTARKLAEAERERLQNQFLQAQKMETVGRLAGGIAHDFNNLLTVIGGYSQMAIDQLPKESPARPKIDEVVRAGERATGLVRQLLVFSRKEVPRLEVVDVNSTIAEMEKTIFYLVGEDISIVTSLASERVLVAADRHQFGQVLMNLIVNARDAMPGGGSITITTRVADAGDAAAVSAGIPPDIGTVCVSVSDTGTGMDEETKQHLFEPFFTTKPAGKGTGLGLSVVHGIVSSCGGRVAVETVPGSGSAFHVYLPAVTAEVPGDTPAARRVSGGLETVLLAEDEPEVRRYVSAVLAHFHYQVIECQDAEDALEMLKTQRVDLLLTDVIMPRMSGRELVLRARTLNPDLRVLFMSGYPGDALDGLEDIIGTSAFIQKPFSPKDLAARIRELLSKPGRS
ncbi:PAS domain S-box protein [Paludibaculum fermentans]|uniref:histidine kinase n=1 Tax=Paludibaculum fermentans TaxID=1473598 RepID=A0A7S7SK54_PALFE|nr:PAS domain S-box protein [Paludibaculum fermentans]QOY87413.1 PAS domain S-box protein [Paludibaculum fermentans]